MQNSLVVAVRLGPLIAFVLGKNKVSGSLHSVSGTEIKTGCRHQRKREIQPPNLILGPQAYGIPVPEASLCPHCVSVAVKSCSIAPLCWLILDPCGDQSPLIGVACKASSAALERLVLSGPSWGVNRLLYTVRGCSIRTGHFKD